MTSSIASVMRRAACYDIEHGKRQKLRKQAAHARQEEHRHSVTKLAMRAVLDEAQLRSVWDKIDEMQCQEAKTESRQPGQEVIDE